MNYAKVFLLILFSLLIGLMSVLRPAFKDIKKQAANEKMAESSCPDSETNCPFDEETGEEGSEGWDEFESLSNPVCNVSTLTKSHLNFTYLRPAPEHFTSICIPPPEGR